MTAIIEVFTTPNRKTKSGEPKRWRWRIPPEPGSTSFGSPQQCFIDIAKHAVAPEDAVLRVEGKDDVPWVML